MKHLIITILIILMYSEIEAQQSKFECLNQNFVENEIKSMRFGHFYNLELKKGVNKDRQTLANYRQQALFYQNKKDEEFDKCQKLPACTKSFTSPTFHSQQECYQYLNTLEEKKKAVEREINNLGRSIGQVQSDKRFSDLLPLKKKHFLLSGEKACIEKEIEACNCNNLSSGGYDIYDQPKADFDLSGTGWGIKVFQHLDQNTGNSISQIIENQNTPVGFAANPYSNQFIFLQGNELGITNWSLETYTDVYSLQEGITYYMENGYAPMGISFSEDGQLHVLYLMSQLTSTAWQLVESELDLGYVSEDVQPYIYNNYIPVGITVFGGKYYTLVVQFTDSGTVNWTIEGYEDDTYAISRGINNMANQGMVPFGFLNEQGVVNVLFVGF